MPYRQGHNWLTLEGNTGSGKTAVAENLQRRGLARRIPEYMDIVRKDHIDWISGTGQFPIYLFYAIEINRTLSALRFQNTCVFDRSFLSVLAYAYASRSSEWTHLSSGSADSYIYELNIMGPVVYLECSRDAREKRCNLRRGRTPRYYFDVEFSIRYNMFFQNIKGMGVEILNSEHRGVDEIANILIERFGRIQSINVEEVIETIVRSE
jgi:thymidylate kinase